MNKITDISPERSLAGKAHVWIVTDPESAECRFDQENQYLTLQKTAARHWTLLESGRGKTVIKAGNLAEAIGKIEYRRFATQPKRAVKAAEIARIVAKAQDSRPDESGIVLIPSQTDPNRKYRVDPVRQTCGCPDFHYRKSACKHLLVATLPSFNGAPPKRGRASDATCSEPVHQKRRGCQSDSSFNGAPRGS